MVEQLAGFLARVIGWLILELKFDVIDGIRTSKLALGFEPVLRATLHGSFEVGLISLDQADDSIIYLSSCLLVLFSRGRQALSILILGKLSLKELSVNISLPSIGLPWLLHLLLLAIIAHILLELKSSLLRVCVLWDRVGHQPRA